MAAFFPACPLPRPQSAEQHNRLNPVTRFGVHEGGTSALKNLKFSLAVAMGQKGSFSKA